MEEPVKSHRLVMVIATCIGSILEMYDFVIYGFFADVLAKSFFPQHNKYLALIYTFVIFAVGYFSRPIGGIIFGHICDKRGRRAGLIYSVVLMGIPIICIALLPTYAVIGAVAPILLLIFRIMQGLSVGGEFPSGVVYLAEHALAQQRGFVVSFMFFGINLGILLASVVGTLLTHWLGAEQILQYGWRLAFIIGGVLAVVGYIIRRHLDESPLFKQMVERGARYRVPLTRLLADNSVALIKCIGVVCVMAASIGTVFLFMPSYLARYHHVQLTDALLMTSIVLLVFSLLIPLAGRLSDFFGREPVMMFGTLWLFLAAYPAFYLMSQSNLYLTTWALLLLGVAVSFIIGPMGAILVRMFPTAVRTTGVAIAYNISFGVFGGLAPLILTGLLHQTKNDASPAMYLMACAVVSLVALCAMKLRVFLQINPARPLDQLPADGSDETAQA